MKRNERIFCVLINLMLTLKASEAGCDSKWPKCPKAGLNTVCVRGEDCSGVGSCQDLGRGNDFRHWMTEKHNELRNHIATGNETRSGNTKAADMNAVSYDLDLEYVAQCHINRCDFNHDKCRLTRTFSKFVGQNLYKGTHKLTDEAKIKHAVQAWYDEIKDAPADLIDKFRSNPGTGHYTQVIWAATTHIGCGLSKKGAEYFLACNYGIGGNIIGQKIYEKGPPCSKCKSGLTCNPTYRGLCGTITVANADMLDPEAWCKTVFTISILYLYQYIYKILFM